MSFGKPGNISSVFSKKILLILAVQALLIIGLSGYRSWENSSDGCIRCHSDKEQLRKLGHPEFFITQAAVTEQSKHKYIGCIDCHLGEGRSDNKDKAHTGMLKMLIVGEDGLLKSRSEGYPGALTAKGTNKITQLLPKIEQNGKFFTFPEVRNILWHDRNPDTFNFDPEIAKKTCAKSGCHPDQLKQFSTSIMGRNYRQRTMRTWIQPYGPHNCGPSFADLPPAEVISGAGFDFTNTRVILDDLNIPFSRNQAEDKQKFCNVCHAGCLDCHFTPENGKPHQFTKVPRSESCEGFGRGTTICHPGAMQSRRGETYIGGDYSVPVGMAPDVHYKKNIHCVDCHPTGEKGMGDMERKASCQDCHVVIEDALKKSIHKNVDCAACHINQLGGYQITVWGPGLIAEKPNPFKKYSLYYGMQSPPILIKDQKGKWMPVKIWPHVVGNIKNDVRQSPGLLFRWPGGETRDAYYVVGTVDGLPGNNKHLLWMEVEQASHPFGKSRSCGSCHGEKQITRSKWEFMDDQGAEPFTGGYKIVAGKAGIRIEGMHSDQKIKPMPGYSLVDFASWIYLRNKWIIPGDFSIPVDSAKYSKYLNADSVLSKKLKSLDKRSLQFSKIRLRAYKEERDAAIHNLDNTNIDSFLN